MNVPSTISDYLRHCSQELGERILQMYPALQAPHDPISDRFNSLLRTPFAAQRLAVMGIVKRWNCAKAAAVIVTSSKSWPDRPHLWFISLRPNYGLTSTAAHWIQQTTGIRRTVRVHSAALPQSLTAKGRY